MEKEEKRKYIFAQLNSLPNAFQYMEVTQYIKDLETQLKKQKKIIDKVKKYVIDYKKQFVSGDDVVGDMQILLEILEDKGE